MIKGSLAKLGLFLLASFSAIAIGFSEWTVVTPPTKTVNPSGSQKEPVCYYVDGSGVKRGFTTIEKGVEAANSESDKTKNYEVVVKPGGFVETCTVTRTTAYYYNEDGTEKTTSGGSQETKTSTAPSFTYSSLSQNELTIKSNLIINSNVTLTLPYIDESDDSLKTKYVYYDVSRYVYKNETTNKETTIKPTVKKDWDDISSYTKATYERESSAECLYRIVDDSSKFKSSWILDSTVLTTNNTDVHSAYSGYMTLNVKVKDGVTITNKGTIRIAGKQSGASGGKMAGFITHYAQLTLGKKSKLICEDGSKLICFGYIVGDNSFDSSIDDCTNELNAVTDYAVELRKNSKTYLPFVVIEHRGGSIFSSLYSADLVGSPFNRFYFPNITNAVTLFNDCFVYGIPDLYASSQHNRCYVNLIGGSQEFMLQSEESSIVGYFHIYKCDDAYKNGLAYKPNHNLLFKSGNVKLNALSLNAIVTVDTKKCHLPVSCYYSLRFENGSLSSGEQGVKLLYGSKVNVAKGYNVSLPAIAVYGSVTDTIGDITGSGCSLKYEQYDDATFVVNGNICADYACGYFKTTSAGGCLRCCQTNDYIYEVSDGSGSYKGCKTKLYADFYDASAESATITTKMELDSNNLITIENENTFCYALGEARPLSQIVISEDSDTYKSEEATAATFQISSSFNPSNHSSNIKKISWSVENDAGSTLATYSESDDHRSLTLNLAANTGSSDVKFVVKLTVDIGDEEKPNCIESNSLTFTASSDGCLLPTARIRMADGSIKLAGDLKPGDIVTSYNHEIGEFVPNVIIANAHRESKEELYNVIHLEFANGKETDLIQEHGFFDMTTNRYEYFYEDNYEQFIGHKFVCVNEDKAIEITTLNKAYMYKKMTSVCSPVSANHLNIVSDGLLSITGCLKGLFNIFDYESGSLKFDQKKMADDIAKYGLLGYETFEPYFPREIYDVLPCKYMAVAVGKGLIDWKRIEEYIAIWKEELMKFVD